MKTFRVFIFVAALTLIAFHVISLDFNDLGFSENRNQYLGIIAMILVGLSSLLAIMKDKNSEKD